jgi:hypothetical protein
MMDNTTQNQVDRLIALYKVYKIVESSGEKELLEHLSDIMRFDTPLVWLAYKFFAYQDTNHAIMTIADLRMHCSDPDDICAKRFRFVKEMIDTISDKELVSFAWENADTASALRSKDLVDAWRTCEFFETNGHICKWQNDRGTLESI